MLPDWLDRAHHRLWHIQDSAALLEVERLARAVAQAAAPKIDALPQTHFWTPEKSEILFLLDRFGLSSILDRVQPAAPAFALAFFELARVDGGLAALLLSSFLPQMPVKNFGTAEQKRIWLARPLRGALCLTETLPGAGSEALVLMGRFQPSGTEADGTPTITVEKRGRFTSHMEFADFAVVAVQGAGAARGSALVLLKPDDQGVFDRGNPVRKIGHRLSSTTDPVFRLHVPATRIVGGYETQNGLLQPLVDHRHALEPALRQTRALLALMTAAKAFGILQCEAPAATVEEDGFEQAELWASGEAAASLGFAGARVLSNEKAALLSSAAKLFSSAMLSTHLRAGADRALPAARQRLADAQIEAMYLGPESAQRRNLVASMADRQFPHWLAEWKEEAHRAAGPQARCLEAGIDLFAALDSRLRPHGPAIWLSNARQAENFALADALCSLLAARSLLLDAARLDANDAAAPVYSDLVWMNAARAGEQLVRIACLQFSADAPHKEMENLWRSFGGLFPARMRIAQLLNATRSNNKNQL